ncbi:unnamed protein product [Cylindrotheca closterium]|uniref:L domain-like protein n=1 Tax=Cylindrotheca closterium TaxID=2856 RepID=A0AAD2PTZ8_9STRA|nr:unnamed protein product [Cylindrotheca closterium]
MVMTFRGYKDGHKPDHEVEIEQTEGINEVEVISTARWASLDQCGNVYGSPRRGKGSKRSLLDTDSDETDEDDTFEVTKERTQNSPPKAYRMTKGWSGINEIDSFLSSMEMGVSKPLPEPIEEKEDDEIMVCENSTIATGDNHHRSYDARQRLDDTMSSCTRSSLDTTDKEDGLSLDTAEKKEKAAMKQANVNASNPVTKEKLRGQADEDAESGAVALKATEEEQVDERIKATKKRICKLVILLVAVIVIIITILNVSSDNEDSTARLSRFNETGSNEVGENASNPLDDGADGSTQPDDEGGSSQPDIPTQPVATDDDYTNPVITVDPSTSDPSMANPLMARIQSMYNQYGLDPTSLDPSAGNNTPQRRAFSWLVQDNQNLDDSTQMTRYALAVFYYSTNAVPTAFDMDPDSWQIVDGWLTQASYCTWYGIFCDLQGRVESIELPENYLTGSLNIELRMLEETLYLIDITDNAIAMSGSDYDVFLNLVNLEELYADNNYLESDNGLPSQMASLVKLEALSLSFNLLSGDLSSNSVLQFMPLLSLLELESNFFSSSIPYYFGNMENLVYLYMRNNELTGDLSFLNAGQMKSLFTMWLDGNQISGAIPASIGTLDELGSLSLTKNRLSGRIPDQLGNLPSLQRVWLNNNELTGEIPKSLEGLNELEVLELHNNNMAGKMPKGLCDVFTRVTYEAKSLTSDCTNGDVECKPDCCTQCY